MYAVAPVHRNQISLSDPNQWPCHVQYHLHRPKAGIKTKRIGTSDEVAAAVAGGTAAEMADELMAAFGSRFDTLIGKDVTVILDLYMVTPNVNAMTDPKTMPEAVSLSDELEQLRPPSPNEAG